MKRKIKIILSVFFGLLVVLAVAVHTPPVKRAVLKRLQKEIKALTGADVRIKSLDYNLFLLRVELLDVEIGKEKTFRHPLFFKARRLAVDVPLSILFGGEEIHIQSIDIEGPELRYAVDASGSDNLPFKTQKTLDDNAIADSSEATSFPQIRLDRLNITDAVLQYRNDRDKVETTFPGLNTELREPVGKNRDQKLSLDLESKGVLRLGARKLPIRQVSVGGKLNPLKISIESFKLQVGEDKLGLNGSVTIPGTKSEKADSVSPAPVYLKLEGTFMAGENSLMGVLLPGSENSGKLDVAAELRGSIQEPDVRIQVKTSGLKISEPMAFEVSGGADLRFNGYTGIPHQGKGEFQVMTVPGETAAFGNNPPPIEGKLYFDISGDKKRVRLKDFRMPGASVDGNAQLEGKRIGGECLIDIPDVQETIRSVNRLPLGEDIRGMLCEVLDTGLSGNSKLTVRLSGTTEAPRVKGEVNGRFSLNRPEDFILKGNVAYAPELSSLEGILQLPGNGRLTISGEFPGGGKEKKGKGNKNGNKNNNNNSDIKNNEKKGKKRKRQKAILRLDADAVDTAVIAPYMRDLTGIDLPFSAVINLSSNIEMDTPAGNIDCIVERFQVEAHQHTLVARTPFDITLGPDGFRVRRLEWSGNGTVFRLNGGLPFTKAGGLHRKNAGRLMLEAEIDTRQVSGFFPEIESEGTLRLKGTVTGTVAKPGVEARLELNNGRLAYPGIDIPVENIDTVIEILGGPGSYELKVPRLEFLSGGSHWKLKGQVPLAGEMLLELAVRNISTELLKSFIPREYADSLKASANLDFKLRGNVAKVDSLTATGIIQGMKAAIGGLALEQEQSAKLNLQKGVFRLDNFTLIGPAGKVTAKATVGLIGNNTVDAEVTGEFDTRVLGTFVDDATFSGSNRVLVNVAGTLDEPLITGELQVLDMSVRMTEYELYISGLNGKVLLENEKFRFSEPVKGSVNGGQLEINANPDLTLTFEGAKFNTPPGLLTEVGGKLGLDTSNDRLRLKGHITVANGQYNENLNYSSWIYGFFSQTPGQMQEIVDPTARTAMELDIDIRTASPIEVENNIAKTALSMDLKFSGTPTHPQLAGRVLLKEGSEIYLGHNTFYVERGIVTFINPLRIEPELDIVARTRVGKTDIRLHFSGKPDSVIAQLSSTPSMPESSIISLLATGRAGEESSTGVLNAAGNRALTFLSNTVSGRVEKAARKITGLETVRIDGLLVASKENPGARLTVGHHIASNLELILSQSLKQTQDRTWIVNFAPTANINLQGTRQDDESYTIGARHKILTGLPKKKNQKLSSGDKLKKDFKKDSSQPKLEKIELRGNFIFSEHRIKKEIKQEVGRPFSYYALRKDIKRIESLFRRKKYLDCSVNTHRKVKNGNVTVFIDIEAGSPLHFEFNGTEVPKRLRKKLENAWSRGQFREQKIDNVLRQLRLHFYKKRYYGAEIQAEFRPTTGNAPATGNQLAITVRKGPRCTKMTYRFPGNHYFRDTQLASQLKTAGLTETVLVQPRVASRYLENLYRQAGYLSVKIPVNSMRHHREKERYVVTIPVSEGPRYKVGEIKLEGNRFLDSDALKAVIPIREGDYYSPEMAGLAAEKIETFYAVNKFYNTRVTILPGVTGDAKDVQLTFAVLEVPRNRIQEIQVIGNLVTSESAIIRQLRFKEGRLVDLKAVNQSRKNLYDTGLFRQVDIDVVPLPSRSPAEKELACRIDVTVKEQQPVRIQYGGQWNTEAGLGLVGEIQHANFGGKGFTVGSTGTYSRDDRSLKFFFRLPYLLGRKMKTEIYLFTNREKETPDSRPVTRTGITLQQQWQISRKTLFSLSYTLERHRQVEAIRLGHLTAAFTVDTRNSLWNARNGLFFSHSFMYAGKWLGSELNFYRYMGQVNYYRPVTGNLISASSLQMGLGKSLGHRLIPGERFFAGGANSLRGYKYRSVGGFDSVTGEPLGGEAMMLLRQELRLDLGDWPGPVVFLDLGNIYSRASDFAPFKLRTAAGFGLRYTAAGLLLRLDWGFKLDRKPGESPSHIYFSIGQSF